MLQNQLAEIIKRTGSTYLAKLWLFYREYFSNDENCLHFFFDCFMQEPLSTLVDSIMIDKEKLIYQNDNGETFCEDVFTARRMLNSVERFVNVARDTETIRMGGDIFKVVYLVACVESLQQLSGTQNDAKKNILLSFFENNTSEVDKDFIRKHFYRDDDEPVIPAEDSFRQFIGVLGEYRNCAAHEGAYWNFCFNNNEPRVPLMLIVNIDLERYTKKGKKEHCFVTEISYKEFEAIFVRSCITFIQNYIGGKKDADT